VNVVIPYTSWGKPTKLGKLGQSEFRNQKSHYHCHILFVMTLSLGNMGFFLYVNHSVLENGED